MPIFVLCEACDGEGRVYRQGAQCWDEIDCGECAVCDGTGAMEVETETAEKGWE